jgi:hypothetical protein
MQVVFPEKRGISEEMAWNKGVEMDKKDLSRGDEQLKKRKEKLKQRKIINLV